MASTAVVTADERRTAQSRPKRFVRNQIPESILNDAALNAAISLLPHNYNFEIHKCVWRIRSTAAKRVALQFPEGLLMYSLVIVDIISTFTSVADCFVLGDVTYGACCVDDLSAAALSADLLIHYGHSCLVPIDCTTIPCLYIFVEISIDVSKLLHELKINFSPEQYDNFIMAGTIQFSTAIRAVKPELENLGFRVLIPQSKPLSGGEVLGCTAPSVSNKISSPETAVLIFVADGRFHLEAFMIANPKIRAYRYDPYMGKLFLEEYDHDGMKEERRKAIEKAKEARNWGVVLGTLGRQGNPRILDRLEKKMEEKGMTWTVIMMSEISPARIGLFEDSVEAWVQIACPRLSIDWGDAFGKPLLTPFEAEIALGDLRGWWERNSKLERSKKESCCSLSCNGDDNNNGGALEGREEEDYPMDYYAQDGGEWNSCYSKKTAKTSQRRRGQNPCNSSAGCC
ncbi:unnamed protein product [Cuscuta campestris]|uniref:2-(3-amino-3-carboxypropyl)histidine synthase subunit 1 n=2 Tax=Cuscuta sect. Cleistogrammica TaxID=1824901 RepID=A0A484KR73_9ASTE|nr:hypothetical protein DM860_001887 [Cuscuta australis]VFQ66444.1 unnamed protein product [Cuscuta campestris]